MSSSNIQTLAANMRNAFIERKGATIGGGKFTPEELKAGAIALKAFPILLSALEEIEAGTYDKWSEGYRAQQIAKAALAEATGETK